MIPPDNSVLIIKRMSPTLSPQPNAPNTSHSAFPLFPGERRASEEVSFGSVWLKNAGRENPPASGA